MRERERERLINERKRKREGDRNYQRIEWVWVGFNLGDETAKTKIKKL